MANNEQKKMEAGRLEARPKKWLNFVLDEHEHEQTKPNFERSESDKQTLIRNRIICEL
jgi:hypothetical protein